MNANLFSQRTTALLLGVLPPFEFGLRDRPDALTAHFCKHCDRRSATGPEMAGRWKWRLECGTARERRPSP